MRRRSLTDEAGGDESGGDETGGTDIDDVDVQGSRAATTAAAAPGEAGPVKPVGYFGSRLTQLEQRVAFGLAGLGIVLSIAGRMGDVLDANAKDHSTALPLVAVGILTSVLLGVAAYYGRRVVTAFTAILPGYFIIPARSTLAYTQFLYLGFAVWMMLRASNEASRNAAERRKQAGPRLSAAERAQQRRDARAGKTVATGRTAPKSNKRYTPPKPKKKAPPPPPAAKSKAKGKVSEPES